jgi:hypothetical protein
VTIQRYTDIRAYRRCKSALLAVHGSSCAGWGALNHTPPPDDPPQAELAAAAREAERAEEMRMLRLALAEAAAEDEAKAATAVEEQVEELKEEKEKEATMGSALVLVGSSGDGGGAGAGAGAGVAAEQEEGEPGSGRSLSGQPPTSFEARFISMVERGEGATLVLEGWTTRLSAYCLQRRNSLPLGEARAMLRAVLREYSCLKLSCFSCFRGPMISSYPYAMRLAARA